MPTIIYPNMQPGRVKRFKYAYEDDPTFIEFRETVNHICAENAEPVVPNRLLYSFWYESKNFRDHWMKQYNNETARKLIYILGMNLLTDIRSRLIMFAWMRRTFPRVSKVSFGDWVTKVFDKEWCRISIDVKQKRRQVNKRRREKRKMKQSRGRPTQTNSTSLRVRILYALRAGQTTTAILAKQLGAHRKAVGGHLERMLKKTKEVVKVCHGFYALASQVKRPESPKIQTADDEGALIPTSYMINGDIVRCTRQEYLERKAALEEC